MIDIIAAIALTVAGSGLLIIAYLRGMRFGVRMTVKAAYKHAGLYEGPIPDIQVQYVDEIADIVLARKNGHKKYGADYHAWRRKSKMRDTPTVRALWDDEEYRKATR